MPTTHRVLVPFELPDAEPLAPVLIETLTTMEAVLLGHYGLPEQTPPTAARDQFEADAQAELDELARPFEDAGVPVRTRLVFGKTRAKTIDRTAVETNCDVVPLRGEANFERILSFVAELLAATDASVTLFHASDDSDRLPGEQILADATDLLVESGVDPDRISRELSAEGDPERSIVELGAAFDLLVLGETEPSLRDRILGAVGAHVTADTTDPVFVVRAMEES
jgi:nucleotide-binding universal stress UspA family protein